MRSQCSDGCGAHLGPSEHHADLDQVWQTTPRAATRHHAGTVERETSVLLAGSSPARRRSDMAPGDVESGDHSPGALTTSDASPSSFAVMPALPPPVLTRLPNSPLSPPKRHHAFAPSSPLSSASSSGPSAIGTRARQGSTSSNVSSGTVNTEPTSVDMESGDDCPSDDQQAHAGPPPGLGSVSMTPNAPRRSTGHSVSDLFATLPSTSATSTPLASAPTSSLMISTTVAPASASRPEEHEIGKGEEGDGESCDEEDEEVLDIWDDRQARGSPLRGDPGAAAPFGELDISPVIQPATLPDQNALGFDSMRPSRAQQLPRPRHQRTLSNRDSSPEVDTVRTARSMRVRSVGRGLAAAASAGAALGRVTDDGPSSPTGSIRRRSRTSEIGLGSPSSASISLGSAAFVYPPIASSSQNARSLPPLSTSYSLSSSPSSPSLSSRRASVNLASPPRSFAPSSPTAPRGPRASISAAPLLPFPAPPPPSESIKLQKVPEAVRSALDFRQAFVPTLLADASNTPTTLTFPVSEVPVPKTPAATRASSPASGSGSPSAGSGGLKSQTQSPASSKAASRVPSRRNSRELLNVPIGTPPSNPLSNQTTPVAPNVSAFSPLFTFPATPGTAAVTRRDRSRSVHIPQVSPLGVFSSHDTTSGQSVSPNTLGVPRGLAASPSLLPFSLTNDSSKIERGGKRLAAHRTSIAPSEMGNNPAAGNDSTDEYAQIILASRNAKMRKWKPSASSTSTSAGLDLAQLTEGSFTRRPLPSFLEPRLVEETANADLESSDYDVAASEKDIEWVDWLDEYQQMKQAKLEAEQIARDAQARNESEGDLLDSGVAKGKERELNFEEYNPFEATTADLNRVSTAPTTTGFLTPDPPVQYFPLVPSAVATPTGAAFKPVPTSMPQGELPRAQRISGTLPPVWSEQSTFGMSPNQKRKKNFKLGNKIDAWWSAVRTSFSAGNMGEPRVHDNRRTSDTPPITTHTRPAAVARTSSQYARLETPAGTPPILRNAASAQNLGRQTEAASQQAKSPSATVPSGALAPPPSAARLAATLQPPRSTAGAASGSDESDSATTKHDSKWRNPNLSLNLGPSFSTLHSPPPSAGLSRPALLQQRTDSSDITGSESSSRPRSPLAVSPTSSEIFKAPMGGGLTVPVSSPGLTPGRPPMWDRTPALIPHSSAMSVGLKKQTPPEAIKDAKAGLNTDFSMHIVRRQIRQRLNIAKESCDKELRRIVQTITSHVDAELRKEAEDQRSAAERQASTGGLLGNFGDLVGDIDGPYGPYGVFEGDSESEALGDVDFDLASDTGQTDSEAGAATSHSSSRGRVVASPAVLSRRGSGRRSSAAARLRGESQRRQALIPRVRQRTSANASSVDLISSTGSASSSRSNSRSQSPLPPPLRHVSNGSRSPAHSSLSVPQPTLAQSAFIVLLQEISTIATEILDTPISKLVDGTGMCGHYIQRVQQIGHAWEDNPELPLRGCYVQLLLAVAGLSRVVEWWEAERGFWTFEDADNEDAEPILFVAKPSNDDVMNIRSPRQGLSSSTHGTHPSPPGTTHTNDSPLGIDLGLSVGSTPLIVDPSPTQGHETHRHTEELRQAVEQVKSQTLLVELSLNDQLFQYLGAAWEDLTGIAIDACIGLPIADFLFPDDAAVFTEATRQLEADDSHTVEVTFRLRVGVTSSSSQDGNEGEDLYEVMEGKGMLMVDGLIGGPSHTMWVIRPAPSAALEAEITPEEQRFGLRGLHRRVASDDGVQFSSLLSMPTHTVLCRICERPTPAWFFEKHNETCNETHRLESDIGDCNDRLKDLASSINDVVTQLDQSDLQEPPEYRDIPLLLPPSIANPPTALEGLKPPLSTKPLHVRKAQNRVFDSVAEILQTAIGISTPSVLEDTADFLPIQDQRLLSPNSENKLALIMRWQRPVADEPALARMVADTEEQIRYKLNSVNRLRNTILYAEKIRQEWEAKSAEFLVQQEQNAPRAFDSPQLQPLPPSESPQGFEPLDMPKGLIRQPSNFGLLSPLLAPDDQAQTIGSPGGLNMLLSPRIPSGVPSARSKASSIKDFKILKPISKGAFGSVYLAKKITTGDYYAIKVLKKSDMIAKNQVTNVKAERMILIAQTQSDFVVKLYYTFQSKDYLYLVMEYLNGGDCAALVKNMGELPEEWARKYIAEVVLGLEHLHASGIIHRDLKPDNLLIDVKGHLKLTDFGLSRIGLLGRQTRMPVVREQRRTMDSAVRSPSRDSTSNLSSPSSTPGNALGATNATYFGSLTNDPLWLDTPNSESSGSNSIVPPHRPTPSISGTGRSTSNISTTPLENAQPSAKQQFVGTPDYLAPESILGIGMDACVDWWALGVICYEFLYGFPPFHDETPERVFENILSHRLQWHEEDVDISAEAHSFMDRLLCPESSKRLGANGAGEVKAHPWLFGIDWDNLLRGEVDFVPRISDPESTDYFDARGAGAQTFPEDDDPDASGAPTSTLPTRTTSTSHLHTLNQQRRNPRERSETEPSRHDDFGTFNFRNLPVLKQANDDVIRQMRDQQLLPPLNTTPDSPMAITRPLPLAVKTAKSRAASVDIRPHSSSPPSPSTSSSSSAPSRQTAPSTPLSLGTSHSRRPSEQHSAIDRVRSRQPSGQSSLGLSIDQARRNSLPSRLRRGSVGEYERSGLPDSWGRRRASANSASTVSHLESPEEGQETLPPLITDLPPTLEHANSAPPVPAPVSMTARSSTIDCLIAGRNPISNKVLETLLTRLGCRCVVVPNGEQAILAAGAVKFDIIWMDLNMDIVDGEKAARMIKSTNNASSDTPIIAVCSYGTGIDEEIGTLFSGTLPKPINRDQVLQVFRQKLKFEVGARRGSGDATASGPGDAARRGSVT